MDDLVQRLRTLAKAEHDDLSIGNDAADLIESLRNQIVQLVAEVGYMKGVIERQQSRLEITNNALREALKEE